MGKAAERRKRSRRSYMTNLAETNPEKFSQEWAKRLASWAKETKYRANTLFTREEEISQNLGTQEGLGANTEGDGKKEKEQQSINQEVGSAFDLVQFAMEELTAYGETAIKIEGEETEEIMAYECCKAVALVVNPKMCRLSNYLVPKK